MAHGGPSKRKLNNGINEDNNDEDELPAPPDGGYGWVVVAASFLIHIISKSFSSLFEERNFLRLIDFGRIHSMSCKNHPQFA